MKSLRRFFFLLLAVLFLIGASVGDAQQIDAKSYEGLKYRSIGPFRGGRVITVSGVPSQPNTYYFGAVAGGVWKTVDGGNTWDPLFEKQPVSSIGAIAVSDSDPNVIYAGSGEACIRGNISYGDGVYKSTDAGKTWSNVGLRDTRHIGAVIVLLLWFYLSGASILLGAEINTVLENAAADVGEPDAKHEGEKVPNQKAAAAGVE
jgi:hypothetical protein